jgi:predicted protein tyrosine phosphatase
MTTINTDELTEAYLAIRTEREKILHDYEEKDAELKKQLRLLEQELLAVCNSVNADSLRTKHGTIMRKLNERFFCSDYDSFKQFVMEHEAIDLLERRIHQGNFRQFMADHDGEGLPPGVSTIREYGVSVLKATK